MSTGTSATGTTCATSSDDPPGGDGGGKWYKYLTPPRPLSRRRNAVVVKRPFARMLSRRSTEEEEKLPFVSIKEDESPSTMRPSLLRRLRNRRARRIAEAKRQQLYSPSSPPSSGNLNPYHNNNRKTSFRCIPAEHPAKLLWDFLTVFLSIVNLYITHLSIRERSFDMYTSFKSLTEIWFIIDILLNFVTEHRIGNVTLKTVSSVSARYLTTWFVFDVISLLPGELIFVKPVIERQKARGFLQKWISRSKAVSRVTGKLLQRWGTVRKTAAIYTKRNGFNAFTRLVRALIKYIPKYWQFIKNMKGVIAVRALRQVHWFRKVYFNLIKRENIVSSSATATTIKNNNHHDDDVTTTLEDEYDDEFFDFVDDYDDDLSSSGIILFEDEHDNGYDEDDDDDDDGDPY